MVNRDLSVRDNSLTNGSIKVMRYLSIQRDNLKCKKQSPKSLYLRWKPGSRNDPVSNENKTKSVVVFHQNVRGSVKQIRRINNFLVCKLSPGTCLSEHHLRHTKIVFIYVVQYKLGAKFCRESLKNGGVGIFEHDTLQCTNINPYPTAFPYGNGMVLHFYQQQESSTTKTVHKVMNKGLKTYV